MQKNALLTKTFCKNGLIRTISSCQFTILNWKVRGINLSSGAPWRLVASGFDHNIVIVAAGMQSGMLP
jgi:hypothetical protein